jgi:hypothetical protein
LAKVTFQPEDSLIPNELKIIDCDRAQILTGIPDGPFREMVAEDLERGELDVRSTIERYFHRFVSVLFDRGHEFWKIFVETLCAMLGLEKPLMLSAIDTLVMHLLYAPLSPRVSPPVTFKHSESITQFLENQTMPRLEKMPKSIRLFFDPDDNAVKTPVNLEDNAFIADLSGFLEHTDEVKCDDGIPRTCFLITDGDVVVDMDGTSFTVGGRIRRSFHFNCVVKLVRVNGDARVALFSTRMKGPLSDEKARRGPAIAENGELFLPFDGEIPFPVEHVAWKEKKLKLRPSSGKSRQAAKSDAKFKKVRSSRPAARDLADLESPITLLSGFLTDEIPILPIVLTRYEESADKYTDQAPEKTRTKNQKGKD